MEKKLWILLNWSCLYTFKFICGVVSLVWPFFYVKKTTQYNLEWVQGSPNFEINACAIVVQLCTYQFYPNTQIIHVAAYRFAMIYHHLPESYPLGVGKHTSPMVVGSIQLWIWSSLVASSQFLNNMVVKFQNIIPNIKCPKTPNIENSWTSPKWNGQWNITI